MSEMSKEIEPRKEGCKLGDCMTVLPTLAEKSVQCCVTSPPYWGLRSYGFKKDDPARKKMIGLEPTFDRHLWNLVRVFREVRRVLRDDGTMWVNYGDSYTGGNRGAGGPKAKQQTNKGSLDDELVGANYVSFCKPKNLIGMAWRVAFALQADGWYLRSDIIWSKRSPMPESVTDRPTKAHEYIFLFSKNARYFYDQEAGRERGVKPEMSADDYEVQKFRASNGSRWYPMEQTATGHKCGHQKLDANGAGFTPPGGRNMRSVWTLSTEPMRDAHFATFPTELVARCLKVGTSAKGCCATCGSPWKRIVERSPNVFGLKNGQHREVGRDGGLTARTNDQSISRTGKTGPTRDLGWRPGCDHGGEPVGCTVLDPFMGSGTVGVVCRRMGLDFFGVELNPEYCDMARRRISRAMDEPTPAVPQSIGQMELIA